MAHNAAEVENDPTSAALPTCNIASNVAPCVCALNVSATCIGYDMSCIHGFPNPAINDALVCSYWEIILRACSTAFGFRNHTKAVLRMIIMYVKCCRF